MSNKPLANPTAFTGQSPPWSLTQLDANFSAIQATINDTLTYSNYFVDQSGVVNSLIVSIPNTLTVGLTAGTLLYVKIANTNTLAVTLTVNAFVAQAVVNADGSALSPSQLIAGQVAALMYDGTRYQLLSTNVSAANVRTAAEIAANVTPTNFAYPPGNVKRYGAKGDSVTDDTTAIQNALNCVQTGSGGNAKVVVPPGIYIISATLVLTNGTTVEGVAKKLYPNFTTDWQVAVPTWGYNASTIQRAAGSHGPIFSGGTNCDLDGLAIRVGQVRTTADVIWATGTEPSFLRMHRCLIQNFTWIANNQVTAWGAWAFFDNQVIGCGQGPYAGGLFQGAIVDMEVYSNAFTSTNGYVFQLTGGANDSLFSGNRFEVGNSPAFIINASARKHVIIGNLFDNHNTAAIQLNSADPGQVIIGNQFLRNGSYGGGTPNGGSAILNACHIYIVASGGHWIDNDYEAAALDNGSAVTINIATSTISFTNTYVAGQPVRFSTTGALPTGIVAGTTYFVSATGLSGAQFQISSSYANGIAGTSITLGGAQSGVQSVTTYNPLWIVGLESVSGVAASRFGGQTRTGCATSQIINDRFSNSVSAFSVIDSIDMPAGAAAGTVSDDFATAVSVFNTVCVEPAVLNLYENRTINGSTANLSRLALRGIPGTAPTLTPAGGGVTGFQSMDNINYNGLTYNLRRGMQYASAQPNSSRTQGLWQLGDHIWNSAPPAAGTVAWVLTTLGSPDTWTGLTIP